MKVKILTLLLILVLSVVLSGCFMQSEHSDEQIKADLIGQELTSTSPLGGTTSVWKFAALSEYEQFDIKDKQKQGNVIEYDVSMRLVDLSRDEYFSADVLVVYRENQGEWELISVVTRVFERISDEPTN